MKIRQVRQRQTPPWPLNPGPAKSPSGRPDVENVSVGELVGEVSQDLSMLMRQELALAKAELKQEAVKSGKAAGLFGGAGFAGYMLLLFLSITAWWGLANVMEGADVRVIERRNALGFAVEPLTELRIAGQLSR